VTERSDERLPLRSTSFNQPQRLQGLGPAQSILKHSGSPRLPAMVVRHRNRSATTIRQKRFVKTTHEHCSGQQCVECVEHVQRMRRRRTACKQGSFCTGAELPTDREADRIQFAVAIRANQREKSFGQAQRCLSDAPICRHRCRAVSSGWQFNELLGPFLHTICYDRSQTLSLASIRVARVAAALAP
jgi:hypothetical protein